MASGTEARIMLNKRVIWNLATVQQRTNEIRAPIVVFEHPGAAFYVSKVKKQQVHLSESLRRGFER